MTTTKAFFRYFILSIFFTLLSVSCYGQANTDTCPSGFVQTAVNQACQHASAPHPLIYRENLGVACAQNYERITGIRHCIAAGSLVDIANKKLLLAQNTSQFCPEMFSREPNSTICTAQNLLVEKRDAKALRFSRRSVSLFEAISQSKCPLGYLRPPGVNFCVAHSLLYANKEENESLGLPVPAANCPRGYHRPKHKTYCAPNHTSPFAPINGVAFYPTVNTVYREGNEGGWAQMYSIDSCPATTTEVWWEMPVYENQTVLTDEFRILRFCLPEDISSEY